MRSSFFEFHVANSALFTARGGLDATGHNVANASTRGYSRQIIEQRASRPLALGTGRGMVGTGAEIYGIMQLRDFYLDKKFWSNVATLGQFSVKSVQSGLLETVLDEMSGNGLKTQFDRFFNLISDLTTAAGDVTYRTNLLQFGDFISTHFTNTYEQLRRQQIDVNQEIRNVVSIINSKSTQIASLNQQIARAELNGARANDLRDQRALLIDELSVYVNLEVREIELNKDFEAGLFPNPEDRGRSQKHFSIHLNGATLVDGSEVNLLRVQQRRDPITGSPVYKNAEDMPGLYDIIWERTNTPFNLYSPTLRGELRGLIDMRDGNNQNHIILSGADLINNGADGRLRFALLPGQRVDMAATGSFTVMLNGRLREFFYEDYAVESMGPPPVVSFRVTNPPDTAPLTFRSNLFVDTGGGGFVAVNPADIYMQNPAAPPAFIAFDAVLYRANPTMTLHHGTALDGTDPIITDFHIPDGNGGFQAVGVNPNTVLANDIFAAFGGITSLNVGVTSEYKGIPYYMSRLNTMARTFVQAINLGTRLADGSPIPGATGHVGGYNVNGIRSNVLFFTYVDDNGVQQMFDDFEIYRLTAANIRVNNDLLLNPNLLQASDHPTGGIDNNRVVMSWLRIAQDRSLFTEGSLGDFINSMVGELGIDKSQADSFTKSYIEVTIQVDNQRMSISGVDIDEEMVSLIRYQQQFRAAANLINAIDRIYDTLINRLGNF